MFERLRYLYKENELTEKQLDIAVSKGWITEGQKAKIIG
ncbi:XkdX family protein [Ruminiclostridium josui]|nr:XkdX family protein [Ruminiclostridium josui]